MSRFNTYLKTAIEIIENYNGHEPFAHYLKLFFKKYRKAGSRDRKNISQLCYSYYRIGLAYCDKTVDEQIILGLFLCTTQYSELLNNLMPQWTSAVHLNILEKLHFLGLSQNPKLFPATSFLNEDLPVIPFEHSHLIKPLHFMRIRPGHTGLINKLTELPIIKINDSCIAWEESLNMEKYIVINREAVIQDASSQRVADFFPSLPTKSKVWDCCAASGGKSILAIDTMEQIDLYVSDVRPYILDNLTERFNEADIEQPKQAVIDLEFLKKNDWPFAQKIFDFIIADVPCTGSGTWGRAPENLRYFDSKKIMDYAVLQRRILKNVVSRIAPNGYLLYITCSVYRLENEEQVEWLIKKHHLKLVQSSAVHGYEMRADSMFAALLQKVS